MKGIEDAPAVGTDFADQRRINQTQQSRGMIGLVVPALLSFVRSIFKPLQDVLFRDLFDLSFDAHLRFSKSGEWATLNFPA